MNPGRLSIYRAGRLGQMIRKIHLKCDNLRYGPEPKPEEEIQQILTLLSDGRVWLSRYRYGSGYKYELISKDAFRIHTAQAKMVLEAVENCFTEDFLPDFVTDIGSWELSVTDAHGNTRQFEGALCKDKRIEDEHLSARLRTALNCPFLFAFDGRRGKKPDELIFCDVSFSKGGKTYCYIADTDDYSEGDQVVVSVGTDNAEKVAVIEEIRYLTAEEAPYPVEKAKHILRKYRKADPLDAEGRLEETAFAPFDKKKPTEKDWKNAYDALRKLHQMKPGEGIYPNYLGIICNKGLGFGGVRQTEEAIRWFQAGARLHMIESTYLLGDLYIYESGSEPFRKNGAELYARMYNYCRMQFEEEHIVNCKFPETALRMGRLFHEGIAKERDDFRAVCYLLEARFALSKRLKNHLSGDEQLAKEIDEAIENCNKSGEGSKADLLFFPLQAAVSRLLRNDHYMTMKVEVSDSGAVRLTLQRTTASGAGTNKKPLWAFAPTLECFESDQVILYGGGISLIWNKEPGQTVRCNQYGYDENEQLHQFFDDGVLVCKLKGGEYYLSVDDLRPKAASMPPMENTLAEWKQEIYDKAAEIKRRENPKLIEIDCPRCKSEKSLYVNLDDGELFAVCHHCFGFLRIPWPERADEPEPGNHWRLM